MNILLTGASGFIGGQLLAQYKCEPHEVWALKHRTPLPVQHNLHSFQHFQDLDKNIAFDIVINLAGLPIADKPWTKKRRHALRESRIKVTEDLVSFLRACATPPAVMISGSAVGFYGPHDQEVVSESTSAGSGFAAELCSDWESAAYPITALGTRLCTLRTGLVLGEQGFLKKMTLPYKLGLGGPLGHGKQWMPWIHIADLLRIIQHLIHDESCQGPYNATAPHPVRNEQFVKALAVKLKRPAIVRSPDWLLKLLLGDLSSLLLQGQCAVPAKLMNQGYNFLFTEIDLALNDLL